MTHAVPGSRVRAIVSVLFLAACSMRARSVACAPVPPVASPPAAPASVALPVADVAAIHGDLVQLDVTVARLVTLMEKQVEQTDLSLAMKRVELSTYLLVEADRKTDAKRDERDNWQQSADSTEDQIAELTAKTPKPSPETNAEDLEQMHDAIASLDKELTREKENLKKSELQLTELENQSATLREEISRWQDIVDSYFDKKAGTHEAPPPDERAPR